eukprot:3116965-Alexandrium_andersonii.AAC.1
MDLNAQLALLNLYSPPGFQGSSHHPAPARPLRLHGSRLRQRVHRRGSRASLASMGRDAVGAR